MSGDFIVDPGLKSWADDSVCSMIDLVNETRSYRQAAKRLGLHHDRVRVRIEAVRTKAAAAGYAPGHFASGVAPGYRMTKVTVQRGPSGEVERTWERQAPEEELRLERLLDRIDAVVDGLRRFEPIKAPGLAGSALCNLATFSDFHLGMLARKAEAGADWNVEIAKRTLIAAFRHMITNAPSARVLVINIQGDFLHFDGLSPVTPTHGHVLDADGSYDHMVDAAIEVLCALIDMGLLTHEEVHFISAEGNHDLAGSGVWLRRLFAKLYEKEPRLTVNGSRLPYYAFQHGRTMIGVHHGHLKKNEALPLLFAAMFPEMWGATRRRYVHTGHRHHVDEKEHPGVKVVQHPTIAAPDAYAARGGWISERQATLITYHEEHGEVGRTVVTPEMIEAA